MYKIKEKYKLKYLISTNSSLLDEFMKFVNYDYYGHIIDYFSFYQRNCIVNNLDGPSRIWFNNKKIVYKEFWVNDKYIHSYLEFANKSNHLICNLCNDFCNQECF